MPSKTELIIFAGLIVCFIFVFLWEKLKAIKKSKESYQEINHPEHIRIEVWKVVEAGVISGGFSQAIPYVLLLGHLDDDKLCSLGNKTLYEVEDYHKYKNAVGKSFTITTTIPPYKKIKEKGEWREECNSEIEVATSDFF
jgi:hypothetical protein